MKWPKNEFLDSFQFDDKCHNLDGKKCPAANASECLARINGLECPTYSKKELDKIIKRNITTDIRMAGINGSLLSKEKT